MWWPVTTGRDRYNPWADPDWLGQFERNVIGIPKVASLHEPPQTLQPSPCNVPVAPVQRRSELARSALARDPSSPYWFLRTPVLQTRGPEPRGAAPFSMSAFWDIVLGLVLWGVILASAVLYLPLCFWLGWRLNLNPVLLALGLPFLSGFATGIVRRSAPQSPRARARLAGARRSATARGEASSNLRQPDPV